MQPEVGCTAGPKGPALFMRAGLIAVFSAVAVATSSQRPATSNQQPATSNQPRATSSQQSATKRNILLITLDTVRADRMGFLGSTRGLTPSLDALARTSIVFTRAYAQAPITTVSHATILSGTYPPRHGIRDFGTPLPDAVPYLPDLFH